MPIAHVQNTNVNSGSPVASLNATLAGVGLAHLLIAVVEMYNNATATVGLSDGGNAWVQCGAYQTFQSLQRLSIWYAKNSGSGSTTLTVTPTVNEYLAITMLEYSGADTVAPFDSPVGTIGNSSSPDSGSCAVNNPNSLLLCAAGNATDSTATWTVGAGFASRNVNFSAILPLAVEDQIVSAAANGNWTTSHTITWACISASFKPGAAGTTYNDSIALATASAIAGSMSDVMALANSMATNAAIVETAKLIVNTALSYAVSTLVTPFLVSQINLTVASGIQAGINGSTQQIMQTLAGLGVQASDVEMLGKVFNISISLAVQAALADLLTTGSQYNPGIIRMILESFRIPTLTNESFKLPSIINETFLGPS